MKKILKQIFCFVFFITFIVPTSDVFARGLINTNIEATLNVYHSYRDKPLKNVKFSIYHIADITANAQLEVNDIFKNYPINFKEIYDSTEWYVLADTLVTYIKTDSIPATNISITNSEGMVNFLDLKVGVYLCIGEAVAIDGKTIQTRPFLVSLPNVNEKYNSWIYDITVNTKTDENVDEKVDIAVKKIWENDYGKPSRPVSITVGLHCDGKLYDTVILSENNNWNYSWSNLNKNSKWIIREMQVPQGYTVSYEVYGSNIIITNTYQDECLDGKDENKPDNMTNKLPVTGEILSISSIIVLAIILIIVGYIFTRKDK